MKTVYLKANNETELWEDLISHNLAHKEYDMEDEANINTDEVENFVMTGKFDYVFDGIALDIIGTITKETGNVLTDVDGNEYNEVVAIDGFHANLLVEDDFSSALEVVAPTTPYRIFA